MLCISDQCGKNHLVFQCKVYHKNMSFCLQQNSTNSGNITFSPIFVYTIINATFDLVQYIYIIKNIRCHILVSTCLTYPLINIPKQCLSFDMFTPLSCSSIINVFAQNASFHICTSCPVNVPFTVLILQLSGLMDGARLYCQSGKTNWWVS